MTPSQICKSAGLDSLAELRRITGKAESTLCQWANEQPGWFQIVVWGAAYKKHNG